MSFIRASSPLFQQDPSCQPDLTFDAARGPIRRQAPGGRKLARNAARRALYASIKLKSEGDIRAVNDRDSAREPCATADEQE
jgi:hypothetical protein